MGVAFLVGYFSCIYFFSPLIMKITRSLISAASALALTAGIVPSAFAYGKFTPPLATTTLRQRSELRELYADAFSSIMELSKTQRSAAVADVTGRSLLARAQVRGAQRNYSRHVLGYLRGVDYRVLNVSGDVRHKGVANIATGNLPFSLVTTGGNSESFGDWMWDRPTRRDIRENLHYTQVNDRDRDLLIEMQNNVR